MTLATELQDYNDGLNAAYSAAGAKGATIPEEKNLVNLASVISGIEGGGGSGLEIKLLPEDWTGSLCTLEQGLYLFTYCGNTTMDFGDLPVRHFEKGRFYTNGLGWEGYGNSGPLKVYSADFCALQIFGGGVKKDYSDKVFARISTFNEKTAQPVDDTDDDMMGMSYPNNVYNIVSDRYNNMNCQKVAGHRTAFAAATTTRRGALEIESSAFKSIDYVQTLTPDSVGKKIFVNPDYMNYAGGWNASRILNICVGNPDRTSEVWSAQRSKSDLATFYSSPDLYDLGDTIYMVLGSGSPNSASIQSGSSFVTALNSRTGDIVKVGFSYNYQTYVGQIDSYELITNIYSSSGGGGSSEEIADLKARVAALEGQLQTLASLNNGEGAK